MTLDTSRISLAALFAGLNVLVVLLVIVAVSGNAVGRLRDLANEQALATVQLGGAGAREDIRQIGEDTLTAARVLASRPTLQRLLAERQYAAIEPFLRRFCETGALDACAVVLPDDSMITTGRDYDWPRVLTVASEQGERFLATGNGGVPAIGAVASLPESDARVLLLRLMSPALADEIAQRIGMAVALVPFNGIAAIEQSPLEDLHRSALADGREAAARIDGQGVYAASNVISAATGETIALVTTRLDAADIDQSLGRLVRRLLLGVSLIGLVAIGSGWLLGRLVARPVRTLTEAASRLGGGDFATSIPARGPAEVGALARTMEDMRRSLLDLTGTLRRREVEAQAVLDGIVEGVFAVDEERRIRYLNPRAEQLLGIDSAAAAGRFCGDVLRPAGESGARPCESRCPIIAARAAGTATSTEQLAIGGSGPRTTVITSSALVDGLQVQVIRDETELEAVRRARDTVLANVSHEFRTPLAAQLASIELLRDGLDTLPAGQRRQLVLSLERGTQRLTRLIDNLLESVRIESGQLALRQQPVNVHEIVEDALELIRSLIDQRHQHVERALPDDLPIVPGDIPRLTQVLVNLLANASKFAPEGGLIRIGARKTAMTLDIWIEDNGPGLPDAASGTLFERFSRGAGLEPEPGGLGLGLWIVRSIVERHGGSVDAARTPEQFTRFTISLPLEHRP